ncbi:MAG: right-handed parallel beta-helix repeat-containing protein [bacterium]
MMRKFQQPYSFFLGGILVFLFGIPNCFGAEYFCDATQGRDTNSGTSPQSAWRTVAKINATSFSPGDTIYFKRGEVWREQLTVSSSGAAGRPITFSAYGSGALPILNGANLVYGWAEHAPRVWKASVTPEPQVVAFNDAVGEKVASVASINSATDWYWASNVLYIYSTSDPDTAFTNPGIEAGQRLYNIYSNNFDYVTYQNLHLKYANQSGFRGDYHDDNLTFSGVRVTASALFGFEFDSSAAPLLEDCMVEWVGKYGYLFQPGCSYLTVNRCVAAYNRQRGLQVNPGVGGYIHITGGEYHHQRYLDADGIAIDDNDGIVIDSVWSHHNDKGHMDTDNGDGIQISGGCVNPIVRYCFIEFNGNSGLVLNSPQGGQIYYNQINENHINGIAVDGNSANTLKIFNNTIYNNGYGILFYYSEPKALIEVMNNILWGATLVPEKRVIFQKDYTSDANILLDYNCYWGDENEYLLYWGGALYARNQFKTYQEKAANDLNSICADPLFLNVSERNFMLQSTSPCVNRGVDLGIQEGLMNVNVPNDSRVDIGAWEYYAKPGPPINLKYY